MSKSKRAEDKLATIIAKPRNEDGAVKIRFEPGLPYDPGTKGMPHRTAWFMTLEIQHAKSHQAETYFVLCDGDKRPNPTYIHAMVRMDEVRNYDLKGWLAGMGYTLVDEIADKKQALRASARRKLSPEECAELGL